MEKNSKKKQIVYLDGNYLDINNAKISVLDRGFIFGDGVYEVIPAYSNHLFRFSEHITRLNNSLKAIRLDCDISEQQWLNIIKQLLNKNGEGDWSIYLHITRGVAKRDHVFPNNKTQPTIFIMCNRLVAQAELVKEKGVSAVTLNDNRWLNCQIKAISLLPNILLKQQAHDNNAQEAILVRDGQVTEGAASNLFIIKDSIIKTPQKSNHLLPGVTRDLIVELAKSNELELSEQPLSREDLEHADEVWLTSSTKEILAVTELDNEAVGVNEYKGKPGPMWVKMMALYQQYKQQLRQGNDHHA